MQAQAVQSDFQMMCDRVRKIHPDAQVTYHEYRGEALVKFTQEVGSTTLSQINAALGADDYSLITPRTQQREWGMSHEQGKPFDGGSIYILYRGISSGRLPAVPSE